MLFDFIQAVWIFDPQVLCSDFINKCLDFSSLENCLTFHDTEHLFSHIGLNITKHTNRLGISTLNSLLIVQFNVPQKFHEFKPNN